MLRSRGEKECLEKFLKYYNQENKSCFRLAARLDENDRNSPQPDFLCEDGKIEKKIVVEIARLFYSQESRQRFAEFSKFFNSAADALRNKGLSGIYNIQVLEAPRFTEGNKKLIIEEVYNEVKAMNSGDKGRTRRFLVKKVGEGEGKFQFWDGGAIQPTSENTKVFLEPVLESHNKKFKLYKNKGYETFLLLDNKDLTMRLPDEDTKSVRIPRLEEALYQINPGLRSNIDNFYLVDKYDVVRLKL